MCTLLIGTIIYQYLWYHQCRTLVHTSTLAALPFKLRQHIFIMAGTVGLEPTTHRLTADCSTDWAMLPNVPVWTSSTNLHSPGCRWLKSTRACNMCCNPNRSARQGFDFVICYTQNGAGDRTRTGTLLPARDFKSLVSAIPPHRQV